MRMRDSEVEQQVLRSLRLDSAIACREISVESQDGVVTLSGTALSFQEASAVHEATRRAPGVRGVVDKIEVEIDRFCIDQKSRGASILALALNVMAAA
jgi:osmotically-inducible protein OsmY